jgi:hypothetical protein
VSPFTGEDYYNYATQDEDHEVRPSNTQERDIDNSWTHHYTRKRSTHIDDRYSTEQDIREDSSSYLSERFEGLHMSYHQLQDNDPYNYSSYDRSHDLSDYYSTSAWTNFTSSHGQSSHSSNQYNDRYLQYYQGEGQNSRISSQNNLLYDTFPRIGFLAHVPDNVYQQWVMEYCNSYRTRMSWDRYVMWQGHSQLASSLGLQGYKSYDSYNPLRHSTWN